MSRKKVSDQRKVLDALRGCHASRMALDRRERGYVRLARRLGLSWSAIGEAAGRDQRTMRARHGDDGR